VDLTYHQLSPNYLICLRFTDFNGKNFEVVAMIYRQLSKYKDISKTAGVITSKERNQKKKKPRKIVHPASGSQ